MCYELLMINGKVYPMLKRVRGNLRRVAFEGLYSRFAWAYDWVSRTFFLGQWRVWQRAAIPHLQGPRVLEVGMGTGDLQLDLLKAGYETYGVDLSPQMLSQAARKVRRYKVRNFKACRARAQALPFPTGYFDSVVSTFPSDYISDAATLREIARVLHAGGRMVVVPGGWLTPRGAKGKVVGAVERAVYGARVEASQPIERQTQGMKWAGVLAKGMAEAGFTVQTEVMANERGVAVVIVGDRQAM